MFTTRLVVLALVAVSCGVSGMFLEEADQDMVDSLNKLEALAAEQVHEWPQSYSDMPEDDETASPEPLVPKEHCHSAVWKVVLVLAVLLLVVLGVMGTVYYLCVWRGGRVHYEQQKDVST